MSDACCGPDDAHAEYAAEGEPDRLWEVGELRAATVAGVCCSPG